MLSLCSIWFLIWTENTLNVPVAVYIYFCSASCVCAGVVKGHKTEGQELFYSVEKEGQRQWYNRTAVILSLEQGNKLREQHSLGPYEPTTPLAKASDISLGEAATSEDFI